MDYYFLKFLILLNLFIVSFQTSEGFKHSLKNGEEFDFIVVGGGNGGCVVAARLAESGKHSVLLIEDGGIPNDNLYIPALSGFTSLQNFPNEFKYYASVPQLNAALARNGIIEYSIGKTIGGGTSVNGMIWNRGNPQDYNYWAAFTKDPSWTYRNLLNIFKKSENYTGFNPTDQRGYSGPITLEHQTYLTATTAFLQAGKEIGYPFADPNGPQIPSVSKVEFSKKRGRRVTAFTGYIGPLLQKSEDIPKFNKRKGTQSNLLILLNTQATRITFEDYHNKKKAVGVQFIVNNSSKIGEAKARKEIIIAAGVMDTPKLLMQSGIGPGDVLRKAHVSIIRELPVGKYLHNHVALQLPVILGNRSAVLIPSRDLTPTAGQLYEETGTGAYSSYMGAYSQGFFLSSVQGYKKDLKSNWPDIQILPQGVEEGGLQDAPDLKEWEVVTRWRLLNVRPKSRGIVEINAKNVNGPPIIDWRVLQHPDDMRVMVDAIKITERLCEGTAAMQRFGCRLSSVPVAACKHLKFRSDSYWNCYVKQFATASIHAAGTARMGASGDDKEAVVDSQLKVMGIVGLRVADASVMPAVTNANTQAPVYAIAEKAAEMILEKWEGEQEQLERISSRYPFKSKN